jgi:hypothetical protein
MERASQEAKSSKENSRKKCEFFFPVRKEKPIGIKHGWLA